MTAVTLARYTARDGRARQLRALSPGDTLTPCLSGREGRALLAARLATGPGLLVDVATDGPGEARVLAELAVGEGLLAADAVVADYLPRARRATRPLARRLRPDDLAPPPLEEAA